MKLCIDPGHGHSSRRPNIYDTGAVSGTLEEAGLVLVWAHCLRKVCADHGISTFLTRQTRSDRAPLMSRVPQAHKAGCTHFLSLHINFDDAPQANGLETLWRTKHSFAFARLIHEAVLPTTGLRDRGIKKRSDLAVLSSTRIPSAMLELGFLSNRADMQIVTAEPVMHRTCRALVNALLTLGCC